MPKLVPTPGRSISFSNHNLTTLNKNRQFRSNFTIRYASDKSMQQHEASYNRHMASSQHSKVNSDNYAEPAVDNESCVESINAVRFQNSNGIEDKKENNLQATLNKSNSKNFFTRLRSSFQSNSRIETNRSMSTSDQNDYRYMRLKRNRKAARMLGILVASFLICWLPYTVFFPISFFYPIPNYLNLFIWWLGYLNSTINPFLYVYSNKNIRFYYFYSIIEFIKKIQFKCF